MAGDSEGRQEIGYYPFRKDHVSWDSSQANVAEDMKAIAEWMMTMCHCCSARGRVLKVINEYPYYKWEICPCCDGSGKRRQDETPS